MKALAFRSFAAALLALATMALSPQVQSASGIGHGLGSLFVGVFQTTHNETFTPDGAIHVAVEGAGIASLLGESTCATADQTQTPDGVVRATYTVSGKHGTVVLTCVGRAVSFDPVAQVVRFEGTFEITSGTGLYQRAKGSGTFSGMAHFDLPLAGPTNHGDGQWAFWGAIDFPK